jgi:hypothetical protein
MKLSISFKLGTTLDGVWFIALLGAVLVSWTIGPHDFYGGGDGKWTQILIQNYLDFARPFEVNSLNPLQGNFSQLYPLNVWLNPAVVQFSWLPFDVAKTTSMLTFLSVQALAMYALARQFGLDATWAAIAGQSAAWFFPHFTFISGIFPIYYVNPTVTITISLFILLLILVLRVGQSSPGRQIVRVGLAATAVSAFIVYNDPMSMGLVAFSVAPCFAVAILRGSSLRGTRAHLAILCFPIPVLLIVGFVTYVLALDYYTYRYVFSSEFPRAQLPTLASMVFHMKAGIITMTILVVGLGAGTVLARGKLMTAVLIGLIATLVSTVAAMIYLFSDFHWWLPLPIYIQFYSLSLVIVGTVAGYSSLWRWLTNRMDLKSCSWSPLGRTIAILVMPAALMYSASMLPTISEPFVDQPLISDLFEKDLAISAGSQWRGSVYTVFRNYRQQLTYYSLWNKRIPTHNENSQTSTPLWYYMTFKIMHSRDPAAPAEPTLSIPPGRWDLRLSAALGIRYIMLPGAGHDVRNFGADDPGEAVADRYLRAYGITSKIPLKRAAFAPGQGYGDFEWFIYELPNPNLGQYSPTIVQLAHDAASYGRAFAQPGFDWRRNVVLERDPGALVPAADAKLFVERSYLRVEARSRPGRSLILLPLQYSNCLKVSGTGEPQLVRANLFFAGMFFSGDSHARIDFDFGVATSRCRWRDIADMERLRIPETAEHPSSELHPFALRRWSDIPERLRQLAELYQALR